MILPFFFPEKKKNRNNHAIAASEALDLGLASLTLIGAVTFWGLLMLLLGQAGDGGRWVGRWVGRNR